MISSKIATNFGQGMFRLGMGGLGGAGAVATLFLAEQTLMGMVVCGEIIYHKGNCEENAFLKEQRQSLHKIGLVTPDSLTDRVVQKAQPFVFTALTGVAAHCSGKGALWAMRKAICC